METDELNLFIVDDNKTMVYALKEYLKSRFGGKLKISTFYDGESCLKCINNTTDVVILDYYLTGKNGNEILKSIKELNPRTEVIMLSSDENINTAVDSFRLGAKNFVVKNSNAWKKISILIETIVIKPLKYIWEFRVTKFITIFLATFISMGLVVMVALQLTS
jgi:DNA-binding NtrC family response regulator